MQYGREKKGQEVRNCFILEKKEKNIQVTSTVTLKDTLKVKSTVAFWIKYLIGLIKLYQPESSVLYGWGQFLSSNCSGFFF